MLAGTCLSDPTSLSVHLLSIKRKVQLGFVLTGAGGLEPTPTGSAPRRGGDWGHALGLWEEKACSGRDLASSNCRGLIQQRPACGAQGVAELTLSGASRHWLPPMGTAQG